MKRSIVALSAWALLAGQSHASDGLVLPSTAGSGTVTSVTGSGGASGLTLSGGPITNAGTLTLGGTLNIANGGTGTATPALVAGSNITISGTWPNQTIAATGGSGTVTSVTGSGGTSGLTLAGGPITNSGTLTLGGILNIANGGSGTATPALVAGSNITISGTWPNQTIAATGGSGTVTSIVAGTGLGGGTITTTGTLSVNTGTSGANYCLLNGAACTFAAMPIFGNLTITNPGSAVTMTVPTTSFTAARTDAAQSFTGVQTFSGGTILGSTTKLNAIIAEAASAPTTCAEAGTGSPTCAFTASAGTAAMDILLASSSAATTITVSGLTATSHFWACGPLFDTTNTAIWGLPTAWSTTSITWTYYTTGSRTAASPGATDVLLVGPCVGV